MPDVGQSGGQITHGRHCACSACAAQDWSEPQLAPCGMHGSSCPPRYDPWGVAGDPLEKPCDDCGRPIERPWAYCGDCLGTKFVGLT